MKVAISNQMNRKKIDWKRCIRLQSLRWGFRHIPGVGGEGGRERGGNEEESYS